MEYLIDTVTFVRYLTKKGKIPQGVRKIFQQANTGQCTLAVSTITLMEILYLGEKNRINTTVEKTIKEISVSSIYRIINLSPEIILTAKSIKFYELHDRMILATAKFLDIPVISPDKKFKSVKGIKTIWSDESERETDPRKDPFTPSSHIKPGDEPQPKGSRFYTLPKKKK